MKNNEIKKEIYKMWKDAPFDENNKWINDFVTLMLQIDDEDSKALIDMLNKFEKEIQEWAEK